MCKVCELGKIVINRCIDNHLDINTAKLQKLLVLMHGIHLAKYNEPLFPESVLIWDCGVAINEIDTQFRGFGGGFETKMPTQFATISSEEQVITDVLFSYGNLDVFELNNDVRLKYLKNKFYQKNKSILVNNNEIRQVFIDNDL